MLMTAQNQLCQENTLKKLKTDGFVTKEETLQAEESMRVDMEQPNETRGAGCLEYKKPIYLAQRGVVENRQDGNEEYMVMDNEVTESMDISMLEEEAGDPEDRQNEEI